MANFIITSIPGSVLLEINGKKAPFSAGELHPYTHDGSGDTIFIYDRTGIFKAVGSPSTSNPVNYSKDRIPVVIGVDTISVDGVTVFADADELLQALRVAFFFDIGAFELFIFKITYYEIIDISSTTSGSLQETPTGATIQEGEFGDSGNSVLSTVSLSGKPTFESPLDLGGDAITVNLDVVGDWLSSDNYADPTALIYVFTISGADWENLDIEKVVDFYKSTENKLDKVAATPQTVASLVTFNDTVSIKGDSKGLDILRGDGTKAGGVVESAQDQFGLIFGGFDDEGNLTNSALAGSNIYLGLGNQYLANNAAVPYGYLKLGGTPVLDENGNEFYPIGFAQLEQELYSEAFTDANQFNISDGLEVEVVVSTALVNGYSDPADFEYSFRLQETSGKSTTVEYWFTFDGVLTAKFSTVIGGNTIVTVNGGASIKIGISSGSVIKLHVQAIDTGSSRNTLVRGDDSASTLTLRQIGFGVFNQDSVGILGGPGITVEPTSTGAVLYFNPSLGNITEVLKSAKDYYNKTFVLKRVSNGVNFVKLSPLVGELIDDITDTQSIVMGQSNDVLSLHSDGVKWHIIQRSTVCWGTMKRTGGIGTQAITTGWTKLELFDTDTFSTPGRLTADQANNKFTIDSVEGLADGYDLKFYASCEFSNNADVDFCIYVGGVPTDLCGIITGRGNRFTPIAFGHTIGVYSPTDIDVYVKGSSAGNLRIDTMGMEMHNVKG